MAVVIVCEQVCISIFVNIWIVLFNCIHVSLWPHKSPGLQINFQQSLWCVPGDVQADPYIPWNNRECRMCRPITSKRQSVHTCSAFRGRVKGLYLTASPTSCPSSLITINHTNGDNSTHGQTFIVHWVVHVKSDRNSCVKNVKRELREKFKPCLLSHRHTADQSMSEMCVWCWPEILLGNTYPDVIWIFCFKNGN